MKTYLALGALAVLVAGFAGTARAQSMKDLDRAALARWGSTEITADKIEAVYELPGAFNGVSWNPYTMTPGTSQLNVNLGGMDEWKCYIFCSFVMDCWRRFAGPGGDGAIGEYGGRDLIKQEPAYVRKYSSQHWDDTVNYLRSFATRTDLMAFTKLQLKVDAFFHTQQLTKPKKFWEDMQRPLAAKRHVMVMVAQKQGEQWLYHATVVYRVIKLQNEILVFWWDPVFPMTWDANESATYDTATWCMAAGRLDTDEWDMNVGVYGVNGVLNSVSVLKWPGM